MIFKRHKQLKAENKALLNRIADLEERIRTKDILIEVMDSNIKALEYLAMKWAKRCRALEEAKK